MDFKKPNSIVISGTGSYVPEKVLTNNDLSEFLDTSDEWIFERSGIRRRHIAADGEAASDMALRASRNALEMAGIDASQIDLVVVTTVNPDMAFPSTACLLQAKLGIRNNIPCFDLSAACSGFVYGVEVATRMMQSGMYKNALVVSSEKMSSIVDWQDRSTCVLFGDGAGAVVLRASDAENIGIVGTVLGADGSDTAMLCMPAGGSLLPTSAETVEKRVERVVFGSVCLGTSQDDAVYDNKGDEESQTLVESGCIGLHTELQDGDKCRYHNNIRWNAYFVGNEILDG